MSLRDNRLILGVNPECVPSHRQDNDWWLSQREDTWAAKKEEDSYCLVKMGGPVPG